MPNVVKPDLPSIAGRGIPDVRTTYDIRGTSVAGGLAKNLTEDILPEEKKKKDKAKELADDAWVDAQKANILGWINQNITDPESQNPGAAIRQKGDKALNITPTWVQKYDDYVKTIIPNNPEQEAKLRPFKMAQGERLHDTLSEHEQKEFQAVRDMNYANLQNEYDKQAIANAFKTEELNKIEKDKREAARRKAEADGLGQFADSAELFESSKMWLAVLKLRQEVSPSATLGVYNDLVSSKRLDPSIPAVAQFRASLYPASEAEKGSAWGQKILAMTMDDPNEVNPPADPAKRRKVPISQHMALKVLDEENKARAKEGKAPSATEYGAAFDLVRAVTTAREVGREKMYQQYFEEAKDRFARASAAGKPGTWRPDKDVSWPLLQGSGKQAELWNWWLAESARRSNDSSMRALQKRYDDIAVRKYKTALNNDNEAAKVPDSWLDPAFVENVLRMNPGSISEDGLSRMAEEHSKRYKNEKKEAMVGKDQFKMQVITRIEAAKRAGIKLSKKDGEQIISMMNEEYVKLFNANNYAPPDGAVLEKLIDEKLAPGVITSKWWITPFDEDDEALRIQFELQEKQGYEKVRWTAKGGNDVQVPHKPRIKPVLMPPKYHVFSTDGKLVPDARSPALKDDEVLLQDKADPTIFIKMSRKNWDLNLRKNPAWAAEYEPREEYSFTAEPPAQHRGGRAGQW